MLPGSREVVFQGRKIRVTSLANLIAMKRVAGRPKDLEAIADLESLAEEPEA
ncbi:MAG: hypothetical protein SFV51_20090 [Bryobacteraceae bacterium]|nr:hypothetical protein [Bryobacteraceae bacterium]